MSSGTRIGWADKGTEGDKGTVHPFDILQMMLTETPVILDSCLIDTPSIFSAAARILFLFAFGSL